MSRLLFSLFAPESRFAVLAALPIPSACTRKAGGGASTRRIPARELDLATQSFLRRAPEGVQTRPDQAVLDLSALTLTDRAGPDGAGLLASGEVENAVEWAS